MVCRECEWSETGWGGGSKGCTVAACRDSLVCVTSPASASTSCSESQMLYGRGMPRPIVLRNFSRCCKYFLL